MKELKNKTTNAKKNKYKNMTARELHIRQRCAHKGRNKYSKESIVHTKECPMCGITEANRKGVHLHGCHVGLNYKEMMDTTCDWYLNIHVLDKDSDKQHIANILKMFQNYHAGAVQNGKLAIQTACARCNPHLETCTPEKVELLKYQGKEAWLQHINVTGTKQRTLPYVGQTTLNFPAISHRLRVDGSSSDTADELSGESTDDAVGESVDDAVGESTDDAVGDYILFPKYYRTVGESSDKSLLRRISKSIQRSSDEDSSDSDVSKRQWVGDDSEDESPPNKRSRRSCVGHPDYSHGGQHLRPVADTQKTESDSDSDERNWNHWFNTYCTKTECTNQCQDKNHKGCERGNQVQMRTKAPHSWKKYCIKHNLQEKDWLPKRRKADFEAKLKTEMGDLYHGSKGTRSVMYYDHLVFKCCDGTCKCPQSSTKKKKK